MTAESVEKFISLEDRLHEDASRETGFTDFGDSQYLEGLRALLSALDNDGPRFSPIGRQLAFGMLKGVLIARLFTQQGWKEFPDYRQQSITRPLIIAGVPRTGTTALHKLLSMDRQFQGLELWLTSTPIPRPPRASWETNPLYQGAVKGLEQFFQAAPAMKAAHEMVADQVDECLEVLKQNFCSNHFGSSLRIPSYDQWWYQQSELPSYRRYADVLRLIGYGEHKTWLLKNPGHIKELPALLDVFPDACVVQTHRDPVKALPSLCSVLQMARGIVEADNVDPTEIGRRELHNWHLAAERAMTARETLPSRQFLDVQHSDFHQRPMETVHGIYDYFDFKLEPETEKSMARWIADNPAGKHGEHRYTLEQFGLNEGEIREIYGTYCERYGFTG